MQVALPRPPVWRRLRHSLSSSARVVVILGAFVLVGAIAGFAAVLPPQLGVVVPMSIVLGVSVSRLVWRRPEIGLVILVAGMPFQQLILARFFAWGVPTQILGLLRFWKEALLVLLLAKALAGEVKLSRVDRLAVLYMAVTATYLALPLGPNSLYIRTIAARELASFVLVFMVARHIPLPERTSEMVERALLVAGVVIAALAFWNHLAPASWAQWLNSTYLNQYRTTIIGGEAATSFVTYTSVGGRSLVRADSLFTFLTLPYYLAIPVGVALGRGVAGRAGRLVVLAGLICTGGILVSVSRSAIGIAPIIALLALWLNRQKVRMIVIVGVMAAILIPIAASLNVTSAVSSGFDQSNPSTSVHIDRLDESNERLWENPGGTGLGTSAQVAQRFSVQDSITNESWYFQVGTDMGLPGVLAYIAFLLAVLGSLIRHARAGSLSALGAVCGLMWIALGGVVLHTLADQSTAWSIFMLVGLALRRGTQEDELAHDARVSSEHDRVQAAFEARV
jgi:hypothetical protein